MTECYLIDSNIWHYAYITPANESFSEIHTKALTFLEDALSNESITIATTHYHIAEIMDLLRKGKFEKSHREKIFNGFMTAKFKIIRLSTKTLRSCFQKSLASGIHIYDYLVALPLKDIVTEIFSADDHFQHQDFKDLAKVTNPVYPWVLREGRPPIRTT